MSPRVPQKVLEWRLLSAVYAICAGGGADSRGATPTGRPRCARLRRGSMVENGDEIFLKEARDG